MSLIVPNHQTNWFQCKQFPHFFFLSSTINPHTPYASDHTHASSVQLYLHLHQPGLTAIYQTTPSSHIMYCLPVLLPKLFQTFLTIALSTTYLETKAVQIDWC